ncbi:MAG: PQQ-binding-like beta-propeller repeat protein, partial [Acidobacteriota bacterium]
SADEGVAWTVRLPGTGQSTPVVWGDLVVVSSIDGEQKDTVIASALSLESGEVVWRRRFAASQQIESSRLVSHAAPTPIVFDDQRVVIFWESGDVVAFDRAGDDLWHRSLVDDYGPFVGNHGVGSSPVRTADAVILQVTHGGPSYFVALDPADGSVRWKADRPEGVAWTTPSVVDGPNGQVIVSSAAGRAEALDAATGEQLWHYEGIERNNVPSVVVDGDLVVVASSNAGHNFALRRGGSGELDESAVVWRSEGVTSGFGSPIVHGDCVLFVNKAGVVTCVGREDGAERWRHRLPNGTWASPIATADRVYFFTEKGETVVLNHDVDGPEVLAENHLDIEGTVHGAAAAPGALILRTGDAVVRVGVTPDTGETSEPDGETIADASSSTAER